MEVPWDEKPYCYRHVLASLQQQRTKVLRKEETRVKGKVLKLLYYSECDSHVVHT